MGRTRRQPIPKGVPALVCVPTGKKVIINGKSYTILTMFYDLQGDYMPLATMKP